MEMNKGATETMQSQEGKYINVTMKEKHIYNEQ